jgi:hypothetical protein
VLFQKELELMVFIRVENVVINTDFVAAVVFHDDRPDWIRLVMAVPRLPQIQQDGVKSESPCNLEFTGATARSLRDYFTSLNHVVDLRLHSLPSAVIPPALHLADTWIER